MLDVFDRAEELRARRGTPGAPRPLAGRTAALVFHKPSLRTRVSFTVGMHDLGGDAVDLGAAEVSEHGRESIEDVARVLRVTLMSCAPMTQDSGSFREIERLFATIRRMILAAWARPRVRRR